MKQNSLDFLPNWKGRFFKNMLHFGGRWLLRLGGLALLCVVASLAWQRPRVADDDLLYFFELAPQNRYTLALSNPSGTAWLPYLQSHLSDLVMYQSASPRPGFYAMTSITLDNGERERSLWYIEGQRRYFLARNTDMTHFYVSPAGAWVYVATYNNAAGYGMTRIRYDGTAQALLSKQAASADFLVFDTTGTWVYFVPRRELVGSNKSLIYRMRPDGSQIEAITEQNARITLGGIVQDEWLIFTADWDGTARLYRMRLDGSKIQAITASEGIESIVSLSPQSGVILYNRSGASSTWHLGDFMGEWEMPLEKGIFGTVFWSPDGRTLFFDSIFGETNRLQLVDIPQQTVQSLAYGQGVLVGGQWSGDGRYFYAQFFEQGQANFWRIEANGQSGVPIPLANPHARFVDVQRLPQNSWHLYPLLLAGMMAFCISFLGHKSP